MIFFQLFSNNPEFIDVPAGQNLFRQGEHGQRLFVLLNGEALVLIDGVVIERLVPGGIVGEVSMVSPGPHAATVEATTDCRFAPVDEARFHFLVQQAPHFAVQVMRVLAERLRAVDLRLKSR